ncbi:hypothetical protein ACA910_004018 [Epithemia clementina (nom. ined.)]
MDGVFAHCFLVLTWNLIHQSLYSWGHRNSQHQEGINNVFVFFAWRSSPYCHLHKGRLDNGPREGYLAEEMVSSQFPQIHLVDGFAKFFVTILLSFSLLKIQKQSRR